jgi:hypothetical protein
MFALIFEFNDVNVHMKQRWRNDQSSFTLNGILYILIAEVTRRCPGNGKQNLFFWSRLRKFENKIKITALL